MKIRAAAKTDVGLKRKLNEDSLLVDSESGIYVVADGMGGHKAGEVASRIVVETMADYWRKVRGRTPPSFLVPIREEWSRTANHLVNSITLANILIHEAQKRPEYHRMGSTVSALLQEGERLWVANVGDSPVFKFEQGRLVQISEEHSMEAERKNLGLPAGNPLDSTDPLFKNILTRVLGLNAEVDVYVNSVRTQPGDVMMMCSDGLTSYVPERLIRDILADFSISSERKLDILIHEANGAGGGDNISVILLEVLEEGVWQRFKRKFVVGPG
jgi:protein phosphatase